MALSSTLQCVFAITSFAQVVMVGATFKRDDTPVFSPQRVNIPLGFGPAGHYIMPVNMATGDDTQDFNFTLAMSSGLTFVGGQGCSSCGNIALYDQTKSTTAQSLNANVSTNFLTDTTTGRLIKETCSMKTANGSSWMYPNQTVVVVQDQNAGSLGQLLSGSTGVSGIVGLGTNLASQSSTSSNSTGGFQAALADSIYGQWLGRNPTATNFSFGMALSPPAVRRNNNGSSIDASAVNAPAGVLNWMQPDPSMYEADQVVFKNIDNSASGAAAGNNGASNSPPSNAPSAEWTLNLDGWVFSNGDSNIKNSRAVVATVEAIYTELYLPQDQANLIHAAIVGSSLQSNSGSLGSASQAWSIPCDASFSFGFVVGGQTFTLNHNSLVIKLNDGTCMSAIEAWTDPNETRYLLGSAFISSIYLIFQVNRDGTQTVGFAPFTAQGQSKKTSHTGAIVGGTIGGVAFLCLVIFGALFIRHYYRNKYSRELFESQFDEPKAPTPYTLGAPSPEVTIYTPGITSPTSSTALQSNLVIPASPGVRSSITDPLFADAVTSDGSQYTSDQTALPPDYHASEAAYNAANPGAARNRASIREKLNYTSDTSSARNEGNSGSGLS